MIKILDIDTSRIALQETIENRNQRERKSENETK